MKPLTALRNIAMAALLAASLLAMLAVPAAAAEVWRVKAGESIQAAIDRASPGDTIEVERARYFGHLLIDKPLTLRGIDRPTIDGELKENTISVKAEDVTIEGLIIANSGGDTLYQHAGVYIYPGSHKAVVRNCDFSYTLFGLWIEKANDVLIENNLITGKRDFDSPRRGNGIQLYNTRRARIIGNN
ncbi:right-handed parallel beta-helix repeat-containing protein, partial [Thauera butanivorans]